MNPIIYIFGGAAGLILLWVWLAQQAKRPRTLPGGRVRAHVPGTPIRGRTDQGGADSTLWTLHSDPSALASHTVDTTHDSHMTETSVDHTSTDHSCASTSSCSSSSSCGGDGGGGGD